MLFIAWLYYGDLSFKYQRKADISMKRWKSEDWKQSKIPPIRAPKSTERFLRTRCAMSCSYRDSQIHEQGKSLQGKYEEERVENWQRVEIIYSPKDTSLAEKSANFWS